METPGTVSSILWHFTGGPFWDLELKKQKPEPKPLEDAFSILKAILRSKKLLISKYKEILKIRLPLNSNYLHKGKEFTFESSQVCCLTDIPIQHLKYHSKRYGKCAIGFYRESALMNEFNPVLYSLEDSSVLLSIFGGLTAITDSEIMDNIKWFGAIIDSFAHNNTFYKPLFESRKEEVEEILQGAKIAIENFNAFVKTFSYEEFSTIYCEREWRSLSNFNFKEEDIAMIILPKEKGYYEELIDEKLFSDRIPIIPWEDLMES